MQKKKLQIKKNKHKKLINLTATIAQLAFENTSLKKYLLIK
jgi:hypothetical protein